MGFWDNVDIRGPEDCWPWTAGRNSWGYGAYRNRGAHVVSWERKHRKRAPKGKCVLHTCDNRPCVNPKHLYLGDRTQNARDRDERGRQAKGSKNGRAKLTEIVVKDIYQARGRNHTEIGRRFGVSRETVSQIKRHARWGWLTAEGQ